MVGGGWSERSIYGEMGGLFVLNEGENGCNHNRRPQIWRPGRRSYLPQQRHGFCPSSPPTPPLDPGRRHPLRPPAASARSQRSGQAICPLRRSPLPLALGPGGVWMETIERPLPAFQRTSTDFLEVLLPHREDAGAILCLVLSQAGVMHVRIKVRQKAIMPPPRCRKQDLWHLIKPSYNYLYLQLREAGTGEPRAEPRDCNFCLSHLSIPVI